MTRPVDREAVKAAPPAYDRNALYYPADHGGDWIYEPLGTFTKVDVIVPGHFNSFREELRVGCRVTCRLGRIEDGITEVDLQVIECPRSERQGDVVVSLKGRDGSFTPCRSDGTISNEKEKAA